MKTENKSGKLIVYLEGEVNGSAGLAYKKEITQSFEAGGIIILSFKDVVYMNSSGLREIIDLFKSAGKSKVELRLAEMSKDIREMFAFTGLEKVFKIFDSITNALL